MTVRFGTRRAKNSRSDSTRFLTLTSAQSIHIPTTMHTIQTHTIFFSLFREKDSETRPNVFFCVSLVQFVFFLVCSGVHSVALRIHYIRTKKSNKNRVYPTKPKRKKIIVFDDFERILGSSTCGERKSIWMDVVFGSALHTQSNTHTQSTRTLCAFGCIKCEATDSHDREANT